MPKHKEGFKHIYDEIEAMHAVPKHSIYSPSSSYLWLNCGRSVQITKKLPEDKGSAASRKGTEYHEYIEKFMVRYSGIAWFNPETLPKLSIKRSRRKLKNSYADFIERSKFVKGWMSKNLYDSILHYTNTVFEDLRPYVSIVSAKGGHMPPCPSFYEERVYMDHIIKGCFGTADYMSLSPKCLYVLDWKFGRVPVEPDSPQLILYALGAYHNWVERDGKGRKRKGRDILEDLTHICTVIIQPEINRVPKYYKFTVKQLKKYEAEYKRKAEKLNKGREEKPAKIGPWCEFYAKCAPYCDKYRKKNVAETKKLFENT